MKLEMMYYIRACEITGEDYEVGKTIDEDGVMLFRDIDTIIYDLVDAYDVLLEKYCDLQEDLKENYEPKKFDPYQEYGISESDFH